MREGAELREKEKQVYYSIENREESQVREKKQVIFLVQPDSTILSNDPGCFRFH